ncbi:MAG TPA: zinc-ribbon domain-containing protein [Verrucomicrobiae bacterium]|jgi:hypothetical protein|nr:zinc-ribbon domain-containing protein [Verrucomicrobiae bacterium]
MSLIACPECRKQISSVAAVCPHCGFPIASRNESEVASQSSVSPALPKEDVSNQFSMIPIDAKDEFEAAKQILKQLNRFRAEGWAIGQAFAGQDGINQYHMENDTKKAILRFDLRPTIRRGVSFLSLTMNTMMAATPECTEQKIDYVKTGKDIYRTGRSGCLVVFLALVFGIIGVITVCIELFIPFGR